MSKKNKHKKNKKSQIYNDNKPNHPAMQPRVVGADVSEKETKLLPADDELIKLENKSVDLLDRGKSIPEVITEEFNSEVSKQEAKLKQDLEREAHITLESEAEHASHGSKSSKNITPLLVGLILGALLMSWWL